MDRNDTPPMNRAERRRAEREAKRKTPLHVLVALMPDRLPAEAAEAQEIVARGLAYFILEWLEGQAALVRADPADSPPELGLFAVSQIVEAFEDGPPPTREEYHPRLIEAALLALMLDLDLARAVFAEARATMQREGLAVIAFTIGRDGLRVLVTLRGSPHELLAREDWRWVRPDRAPAH